MTDYKNYKAEDLLLDEGFLNYCKDSNARDAGFWQQFLADNPGMQTEADRAKKIFHLLSVTAPAEDKKEALGKLRTAIGSGGYLTDSQEQETPVISFASRKRNGWIRYAAAAVIIGLIAAATFWVTTTNTKDNTGIADFSKVNYKEVIHATNDERKRVELPDGSVAELNYGTVLKIADNFNQEQRWLYLEGEAFFSVVKNPSKPFVVITGKTATTALGTSFKVRSYAAETAGNVMLATGKVKVQSLTTGNSKKEELILLPGEAAGWDREVPMLKSLFDQALLQSWRNQHIIFEKANLDKIISTLEFYYGVQVKLQNEPKTGIAFTGKFFEKSLNDVLETIAFTNKFEYTRTGSTVSIRFQ